MTTVSGTGKEALTIASTPKTTEQVYINLSPAPAQAKVVREGYQVPAVELDVSKSSFFVDNLQQISRKDEPRVVSQSVPAGTKVMPGTAVDLVLAPTSAVPFDIFQNPHKDLKGKTLNVATEGILEKAEVRQILLKYDTPDDVPAGDKNTLISQFASANVHVDEASADTGFDAAFNSLRGALAFR